MSYLPKMQKYMNVKELKIELFTLFDQRQVFLDRGFSNSEPDWEKVPVTRN